MTANIVTANRLRDGEVVYVAAAGGWTEWLAESRVARSDGETAALLAIAEAAFGTLPFELWLSDFAPCQGPIWAWIRCEVSWPKGSSQPKGGDIPRITPPKGYRWKVTSDHVVQKPWVKCVSHLPFRELREGNLERKVIGISFTNKIEFLIYFFKI